MQWKKAYRISVTWNNGEVTQVLKNHQEMHEFHRKLIQLTFDDFRPSDGSWPASIPYLPGLFMLCLMSFTCISVAMSCVVYARYEISSGDGIWSITREFSYS